MKEYATLKLTLTVDTGGYHCTESHRVTIRQWTDVLKALAPTQTGEENAGLVEDAATDVEALEKQATRIIFEAMPRPECCQPGCTITPGVHPDCGCYMDAAIIAYDLRHLLASRSPIPGGALQNQLTRNPGELAATNPIPGEARK